MIVHCTRCHAEWQTVENDILCYDCGSPGRSIGSDYMSEKDNSVTLQLYNNCPPDCEWPSSCWAAEGAPCPRHGYSDDL